ncbi:Spy/CpxP family protein refolding chaperone [Duganella fentianensis]|uniref:Spy/CpxP family protein refolding chaperone n=1 Tax=Duganella fentianensis TaxID=2692177 RepID=UPI0032B19CCC
MKIKNASAYPFLLAGLLALPLMPAAAMAAPAELEVDATAGHPAMPPGGPGPLAGPGRAEPAEPRAVAYHHRAEGPGPQGGDGPAHSHPPMPGGMGMGMQRPPMLHGVDLSEAQQDKVFAILHAEAPYVRDQAKLADKAGEALRAMGLAAQYDDAKAAALAKEAATAMASIALQRVRTEQKLLAILTPEQRKKLAERAVPPQRRP